MSVTIGRLHVRASVPRRLRARAPYVERLAREVLPAAAARRLAGRLPSHPRIYRIRRLHVRVRVTARQLTEAGVADAWAEAFCTALLTAMSGPPSGAMAIADSAEAWLADVVAAVLDGGRLSQWPFDEFAALDGHAAAPAVAALVRSLAADWPGVLRVLSARGNLGRLVSALGAHGCRDVLFAMADRGPWIVVVSAADLVGIARRLVNDPAVAPFVRSESVDALALRLVAGLGATSETLPLSPPALRAAVVALFWLANHLTDADAAPERTRDLPASELADAPGLVTVVRSLLLDRAPGTPGFAARTALDALLPSLADPVRSRVAAVDVRDAALAGVLLLVPIVDRLGWPEAVRRSALGAQYGSRAITYVLSGLALALAGQSARDAQRFDPGIAVFAGWVDAADPAALVRLCRRDDVPVRHDLLGRLCGEPVDAADAQSWDSVFTCLASRLLRAFASRLRGLSRSSDRFLIDRIVAVPGTIVVEERVVRARLRSNPLWPALHVSGADTAVDAVSWLDGRRLEFEFEGL